MLSAGVTPSTVTKGAEIQRIRIACALLCSQVTQVGQCFALFRKMWQAYLATSCDAERTSVSRYLERLASDSAWLIPVNVALLETGRHYKICIDLDGPLPNYQAGDSGLEVYVNGLVAQSLAVSQAASQRLSVTCADCTSSTWIFLTASHCGSSLLNVSLSGAAPELTLSVNAQGLETGKSYGLCVDLGFGPGMAGQVYVTPRLAKTKAFEL